MKHTTTINGVVIYELEPESSDDRHVIEIMKGKDKVTMRQSNKGGIIFALEPSANPALVEKAQTEDVPVDLSNIEKKGMKS